MRKLLLATSALMLFGAGTGLAQDAVNPGTGQFETQNLSDEPTPEFVDRNGQATSGMNALPGTVDPGTDVTVTAQGDCISVEPGTGQFEPSDLQDEPHPDFVDTECPEPMIGGNRVITGSVNGDDGINPGTGQFEPSDIGDEQTPEFVEPEIE